MESDMRNAMHVVSIQKALRQFIVNWNASAGQMIRYFIARSRKQQGCGATAREIMTYPGLSAEWRLPAIRLRRLQ